MTIYIYCKSSGSLAMNMSSVAACRLLLPPAGAGAGAADSLVVMATGTQSPNTSPLAATPVTIAF